MTWPTAIRAADSFTDVSTTGFIDRPLRQLHTKGGFTSDATPTYWFGRGPLFPRSMSSMVSR